MNQVAIWLHAIYVWVTHYPILAASLLVILVALMWGRGTIDQTTPCASCDHPLVAHRGQHGPCVRCRCGAFVPRR